MTDAKHRFKYYGNHGGLQAVEHGTDRGYRAERSIQPGERPEDENGRQRDRYILTVKPFGIYSLGIAVVIGVILMFVAQFTELYQIGFKYRFYLNFKDPDTRAFFKLFFPTSANMLFLTGKNILTTEFLTFFAGGNIIMMNSLLIIEAPLGFVGIAIGTVLMPLLSKFSAEKNHADFNKALVEGLTMLSYFMLPITVFFILFPDTVVNSVFRDVMRTFTGGTGKYGKNLLEQTYIATTIYAVSLFAMGATVIFEKIYYSLHDAKTPLRANIMVFIFSFAFYFSSFIPGIGFYGVFLADMIAAWMTFVYYMISLRKTIDFHSILKDIGLKPLYFLIFSLAGAGIIYPFYYFIYKKGGHPILCIAEAGLLFAVFGGIYYLLSRIFRLELKR